ncbi:hypothetical protein [Roseburia sp. 499]|nr:hypothetical protein [Roseburia sp. 499]WVK71477.1 hypothetical protein BIV20_08020 [Roseburia sp. 499]
MGKLIVDGNSVYEIDEECIRKKEKQKQKEKEKKEKEEKKQ